MYEEHFGFDRRPFSLTPDPEFLYWTRHHRLASQILEMGVRRLSPITLVTGELGAGKTTLVRQFLETVSDELRVGLLSNVIGDSGDLYRWILMAFGEEAAPGSAAQSVRQVQTLLTDCHAEGRSTVLIVDEAQNVSDGGLESLRLLTNVNSGKDVPLMLVLVGQPELRDRLRQSRFRAIAQRVGASFHLGAMSAAETAGYVRHRIAVANGPADLFTDDALQAVHEFAGGIPRLTNTLCEMCLVSAFGEDVRHIDAAFVRSVQSEMQGQSVAYGLGQAAAAATTRPAPRRARPGDTTATSRPAGGRQRAAGRIRLVQSDPAALRSAVGAGSENQPTVALLDNTEAESLEPPHGPNIANPPPAPAAPRAEPARQDRRAPAGPKGAAPAPPTVGPSGTTDHGPEPRDESADEDSSADLPGATPIGAPGDDLPAECVDDGRRQIVAGGVAAERSGRLRPRLRGGRAALGYLMNGALVAATAGIALSLLFEGSAGRMGVDADRPAAMRAETAMDNGSGPARPLASGAVETRSPDRLAPAPDGAGAGTAASRALELPDSAVSQPGAQAGIESQTTGPGSVAASHEPPLDTMPPDPAEVAAADRLFREALDAALTDPAAASVAYARAAVRGHDRAAYYLGQMYETGDGVPQDPGVARAWYQAAADDVAGARRRLAAVPARPAEGPVGAPVPVFSGLTEAGRAELVWNGGAGPFLVELTGARDRGAQAAITVGTSAARLSLPDDANFWRVTASGGHGPASEWQPISAEVAARMTPGDPKQFQDRRVGERDRATASGR